LVAGLGGGKGDPLVAKAGEEVQKTGRFFLEKRGAKEIGKRRVHASFENFLGNCTGGHSGKGRKKKMCAFGGIRGGRDLKKVAKGRGGHKKKLRVHWPASLLGMTTKKDLGKGGGKGPPYLAPG